MRFLGSKFTQNALAAEAPHRTPLGKLKRSPDPLADFRGPLRGRGKGKGRERGRKRGGERGRGYWGMQGEGRGERGKGEEGGKGRGFSVIGVGG